MQTKHEYKRRQSVQAEAARVTKWAQTEESCRRLKMGRDKSMDNFLQNANGKKMTYFFFFCWLEF